MVPSLALKKWQGRAQLATLSGATQAGSKASMGSGGLRLMIAGRE
jgi:hypothetical protein